MPHIYGMAEFSGVIYKHFMKAFAVRRSRSARMVRRRSLQSVLRSAGAQATLKIGQPNDKYEREADSVADRVVSMPDSQLQRQPDNREEEEKLQAKPLAEQITPLVQRQEDTQEEEEPVQAKLGDGEIAQRQPAGNEEEEEQLQTKSSTGEASVATPALESGINSLKSGGQPLDPATRSFFEPRFGRDFSDVRLHTDSTAADTARSIHARAFTVGNHIAMGSGEYQPSSQAGQRLLGHELTHVVQQKGGGARKGSSQPRLTEPLIQRQPQHRSLGPRATEILSNYYRQSQQGYMQDVPSEWQAEQARVVVDAVRNILDGFGLGSPSRDSPQHPDYYVRESIITEELRNNALWDLYKAVHGFEIVDGRSQIAQGTRRVYWLNSSLRRIRRFIDYRVVSDPPSRTMIQNDIYDRIVQIRRLVISEERPAMGEVAGESSALAYEIRSRFPNGITVILSIPEAYENRVEAEELPINEISAYAYREVWRRITHQYSDEDLRFIQARWEAYRMEQQGFFLPESDAAEQWRLEQFEIATQAWQTAKSGIHQLEAMPRNRRTREWREQRRRLGQSRAQAIQRRRSLQPRSFQRQRNRVSRLDENYNDNGRGQKRLIRELIWNSYQGNVRNYIFENHHDILVSVEINNNAVFPISGSRIARQVGAIGLDENSQVVIGQATIFRNPEEIIDYVNDIHNAVLDLLQRAPSQKLNGPSDEEVARIRSLAILAHGSDSWMGGRGHARSASFRARRGQVTPSTIVEGISDSIAPDIRLRLYACNTGADTRQSMEGDPGGGGIADLFRERLVASGHEGASVIGHTTSGSATRNPNLREFRGVLPGRSPLNMPTFSEVIQYTNQYSFPSSFIGSELVDLGIINLVSEFEPEPWMIDELSEIMERSYRDFRGVYIRSYSSIGSLQGEAPPVDEIIRSFIEYWRSQASSYDRIGRLRRRVRWRRQRRNP